MTEPIVEILLLLIGTGLGYGLAWFGSWRLYRLERRLKHVETWLLARSVLESEKTG